MKDQKVAGGWLTAEYSMLPYSTLQRKARDISKGRLDGRSVEIQRLIGRSLRAVVDLELLGPRTLCIDCDVLAGRWRDAHGVDHRRHASRPRWPVEKLIDAKAAHEVADPEIRRRGERGHRRTAKPLLDLNYLEDKDAAVDHEPRHDRRRAIRGSAGLGRGAAPSATKRIRSPCSRSGKKGIAELICGPASRYSRR